MLRLYCILTSVISNFLVLMAPAWGQEGTANREISVNYVYAAQLGIGTYDIGGLSVDVFSLPLSVTRPLPKNIAEILPVGNAEAWQVRYKTVPSFGVFKFEQSDPAFGKIDIEQYTLAVVPGVEIVAPVTESWRLKPFVDLGLGKIVASNGRGAGDENFFVVYSTGLRSVVEFPVGSFTLALGNGAIFAGNREIGADDEENYWAIETGAQLRHPLGFTLADLGVGDPNMANASPEAGVYFIHYYFPEPLLFSRFLNDPLEVRNQFEIGATLGSATDWDLFSIPNPQIGASYIFGDDLTVFRINFGFPF